MAAFPLEYRVELVRGRDEEGVWPDMAGFPEDEVLVAFVLRALAGPASLEVVDAVAGSAPTALRGVGVESEVPRAGVAVVFCFFEGRSTGLSSRWLLDCLGRTLLPLMRAGPL